MAKKRERDGQQLLIQLVTVSDILGHKSTLHFPPPLPALPFLLPLVSSLFHLPRLVIVATIEIHIVNANASDELMQKFIYI